MRSLGRVFTEGYRMYTRLRARCFSLLISGAFAHFGRGASVMPPLRFWGEWRIAIGEAVFLGPGCWLQTLPDGENRSVALVIGAGTSIAGACHISALRDVRFEEHVLMARNVYVSDHIHRYTERGEPVQEQGIDKLAPVLIKRGAWIGENVVICPGVTIGRGAVVGANSVVNRDVPDYSVAAGAPARVVKQFDAVASATR
jgi:acetyltransferase-like isoleucine patch superfamily enzyme